MSDSILLSTKKVLSIPEDYDVFDDQVVLFINSAFATLNQLGVGPEDGFSIQDATETWTDFIGVNPKYDMVKTYVYLKTRALFDPPQMGYLVTAMDSQINQLEWRLNVLREETEWRNPNPTLVPED